MNSEKKKFDIWPLVVGVIAAIGIIGSSSTGGITKQTPEAASTVTTASSTPSTIIASTLYESGLTSGLSRATSDSIQLVSLTTPVKAGDEADILILAKPETAYMIEIRYGNSVSTVSGLEKKTADLNGNVRWHWRVGPVSIRGEYLIVITGGGQTLETRFQVN